MCELSSTHKYYIIYSRSTIKAEGAPPPPPSNFFYSHVARGCAVTGGKHSNEIHDLTQISPSTVGSLFSARRQRRVRNPQSWRRRSSSEERVCRSRRVACLLLRSTKMTYARYYYCLVREEPIRQWSTRCGRSRGERTTAAAAFSSRSVAAAEMTCRLPTIL